MNELKFYTLHLRNIVKSIKIGDTSVNPAFHTCLQAPVVEVNARDCV